MRDRMGSGGHVRLSGRRIRRAAESPPDGSRTDADGVAVDFAKQLIALAAGVLALSGTFISRLAVQSTLLLIVLALSWALLLVSIFCGLQTMSAIILSRLQHNEEWSKGRAKTYAWVSKWAFFVAVAVFALYAFLSMARPHSATDGAKGNSRAAVTTSAQPGSGAGAGDPT